MLRKLIVQVENLLLRLNGEGNIASETRAQGRKIAETISQIKNTRRDDGEN